MKVDDAPAHLRRANRWFMVAAVSAIANVVLGVISTYAKHGPGWGSANVAVLFVVVLVSMALLRKFKITGGRK